MPRKKEPSFKVKTIIWDKAATTGKKPEVILRELENELRRLYKECFYVHLEYNQGVTFYSGIAIIANQTANGECRRQWKYWKLYE